MNATPKWAVRFDYQTFGIDGDVLGANSNASPSHDTVSIGLDYRFGKGDRGSAEPRSRNEGD